MLRNTQETALKNYVDVVDAVGVAAFKRFEQQAAKRAEELKNKG